MRICSFLPSGTEIVYALGLGDSLYGVSHECDYPPAAKYKPRVVRSQFDSVHYTSREIDRLVSEMASRGERIYEVDLVALRQARPDLVITQELCEVCAISLEDVERASLQLDVQPTLVSLDPHGLDDILRDIEKVGKLTSTEAEASKLTSELKARIDVVRSRSASADSKPKVACIEWIDPLIIAGHWVPEMVQLAGGFDGMVQPGAPSRRIELEDLVVYEPDVLILMPCGMNVVRAIEDFSLIDDLKRWRELPAAREGRAYAVDAGALFSRSGPRLVDGLEVLARLIHPELFSDQVPKQAGLQLDVLSS